MPNYNIFFVVDNQKQLAIKIKCRQNNSVNDLEELLTQLVIECHVNVLTPFSNSVIDRMYKYQGIVVDNQYTRKAMNKLKKSTRKLIVLKHNCLILSKTEFLYLHRILKYYKYSTFKRDHCSVVYIAKNVN